ncbi:MAG: NADP-dependent isocitrate dehydrogenase [Streptococcaceae bacterium]|nr:NADP-dependent isocitrate dehydrogenase [Streptococcaceae bacterium]
MKIEVKNGKLSVPNIPTIGYIRGDGVGEDIFPEARRVFDAAVEKVFVGEKKIDWQKLLAGGEAFELTGEYLPEKTLEQISKNLIAIKGPLMTPVGESFRSINVTLRQKLDLYACVRPVEYFSGIIAPVKEPKKVNMTIFRENTEDIYAGIEFASDTSEAEKLISFLSEILGVRGIRFPQTSAIGVKPVSPDGTKRLVRSAFDYALQHGKKRVTIVHKGNIMKFTEGGFRKWAYEVASEYPTFTKLEYDKIKKEQGVQNAEKEKSTALKEGKIYVDDVIADNFLQQIILNPQNFDVIATLNLNGDYISDALAAQVGGIGIAPGANINYKTGHAIFEATHGTAPDIAGLNKANPSSLILSGVMMFEYIGWQEVADLIKLALSKVFQSGAVTSDLGGELSTTEFADQLIDFIGEY